MSRGIGRDRSDIFHLRKNGASSACTITDKSGLSRSTLEFRGRSDTMRFFRLRGVSFMYFLDRSLSWTFFFLLYFLPFSISFVAQTFQMALIGRSEPSRECGRQWNQGCCEKKNGGTDAFSPEITPIKTPPRSGNSSSILPKSDRWQERLLLRLSTYKRYKHGYSYFLSPRSAVYTRRKEGGMVSLSLSFSHPSPPSFHRANIFLVGQLYITGHAR